MTKEFRKLMGFSRKDQMHQWLSAKDIQSPNWVLIEKRNDRLVDIFTAINSHLELPYSGDIGDDVWFAYNQIKANNILQRMRNNGRAMEDVYFNWVQGYIAEKVFTPLIADKLKLSNIERNGSDDLTNIETFKRTGDADLIDKVADVRIDVQCGTGDGVATIKKHKVDHALKNTGTSYCFLIGLFTGQYGIVNLNELRNVEFTPNQRWEGQLCWDVPSDIFKNWYV